MHKNKLATMKLKITIENSTKVIDIPEDILKEGETFFQKMDRDMDKGWQMGPEFIEKPDQTNRCQIAADKMLVAIENQNKNLLDLMAGYILSRMPAVVEVRIDTHGEMLNTEIVMEDKKALH